MGHNSGLIPGTLSLLGGQGRGMYAGEKELEEKGTEPRRQDTTPD